MASRLPLARYRDTPAFLRAAMAIRGQLARASGLVGYALDAYPARKTFYTVSAWDSQDALDGFSHATRTAAASASSVPGCGPPRSRTGPGRGADLPISWAEVRRRIAGAEKTGIRPALACGTPAG